MQFPLTSRTTLASLRMQSESWSVLFSLVGMATVAIALLMCLLQLVDGGDEKIAGCASLKSGVSLDERKVIIQVHNDQRTSLATGKWNLFPAAANMMKLNWDEKLATKAQEFADGCGREQNGVNLMSIIIINKDLIVTNWTNVIENLWYKGFRQSFTSDLIDNYLSKYDIFSYAPLAWAELYQVGCGFNAYKLAGSSIYHLYMCIYGPTYEEDLDGKSIYQKGQPCSKCPPNSECSTNQSLCDWKIEKIDNFLINSSEIISNKFSVDLPLLSCKFDVVDCTIKSIGVDQWQLHNELETPNEKFYEVGIGRGGNSALFILNGIAPSPNGFACLMLRYRKHVMNGSKSVPLKVFSWSLMGPPIETEIIEDKQHWTHVEIPIQQLKGFSIVFFHLSVPNDPSYTGLVYASLDDFFRIFIRVFVIFSFFIFFLIIFLTLWTICLSCKYARLSPKHTMCRQPSPTCDIHHTGLTRAEKDFILHFHNQLRQKVATGGEKRRNQPPASNMQIMRWDEELAQTAQKHSEQCKFAHDCPKCREVDRFTVGQNVYLRSSTKANEDFSWEKVILAWYDEVALLPASIVNSFNIIPGTLHYTQMVWWDTATIGCGYTYYKDGKFWKKLFVCNYGPNGNWLDEAMYNRGPPCSECPSGSRCSKRYFGLCGIV
uniref:Cysteine-rich venom protein n=1 Tax=Strigamia maritima TaxID=126957 RepID=T1JAR0_STRMM